MTRAPKDHERPTSRLVQTNGEPMVVEFTERQVSFRYPRSREPIARTTWGIILLRLLKA
mgnify:CR=1 FL=1